MRTRIYLRRLPGTLLWDEDGGYIDVSHEHQLTAEDVEGYRVLAKIAIDAGEPDSVRACPPRDPMSQR